MTDINFFADLWALIISLQPVYFLYAFYLFLFIMVLKLTNNVGKDVFAQIAVIIGGVLMNGGLEGAYGVEGTYNLVALLFLASFYYHVPWKLVIVPLFSWLWVKIALKWPGLAEAFEKARKKEVAIPEN
jgi:hypothetical protein